MALFLPLKGLLGKKDKMMYFPPPRQRKFQTMERWFRFFPTERTLSNQGNMTSISLYPKTI